MALTFSRHARARMRERGIAVTEVRQALMNVLEERPGNTADRVNIVGVTWAGRRLRITTYMDRRDFVITVAVLERGTP